MGGTCSKHATPPVTGGGGSGGGAGRPKRRNSVLEHRNNPNKPGIVSIRANIESSIREDNDSIRSSEGTHE